MGNQSVAIDTENVRSRGTYHDRFQAIRAPLDNLCRLPGVQLLECSTAIDPYSVLTRHFKDR